MKESFSQYLNSTSLEEPQKSTIEAIFSFVDGTSPTIFANRSFIFYGEPGIGNSYLARKIIEKIDKPILFWGQNKLNRKNIISVKDSKDLLKNQNPLMKVLFTLMI